MEVIREGENSYPFSVNGEHVPHNNRAYRGVFCPTCGAEPGHWCQRVADTGDPSLLRALHQSRIRRLEALDKQGWPDA
jgi:hypothetical protein